VVNIAVKLTTPNKKLKIVGSRATGRTFCSTLRTIFEFELPCNKEATRKKIASIQKCAAVSFWSLMNLGHQAHSPYLEQDLPAYKDGDKVHWQTNDHPLRQNQSLLHAMYNWASTSVHHTQRCSNFPDVHQPG